MTVRRRLYWVTPEVKHAHEKLAQRLAARHFDVRFFATPEQLQDSISHERAGIILISDSGIAENALARLHKVTNIPETKGARLFLIIEQHHAAVTARAAASNFRDVIPLDLEEAHWIKRLEYGSASRAMPFAVPSGQVTMSNISAIHVPARLVWISGNRMRIETSMTPKVGSILNITGGLAKKLGLRSLTMTVEKTERSHLRYRFSDAIVGKWNVPREVRSNVDEILGTLRSGSEARTCRVLLAARSTSLRKKIFAELRQPLHEINSILKTQSMTEEPKYFSPDVVIIEAPLCVGEMAATFSLMLETLPQGTPVIVTGDNGAAEDLARRHTDHLIIHEKRLPPQLLNSELKQYLSPKASIHADADGIPIAPQDRLSYAEVTTPARLACLHPAMIQIDLPHRIRTFSLCRLSSPILGKVLGRDIWIKFTESFHNDQATDDKFGSTGEAIMCDLTTQERRKMAQGLLKIITGHYQKLYQREDSHELFEQPMQRTPELGSLHASTQAITVTQVVPKVSHMDPAPSPQYGLRPVAVSAQATDAALPRRHRTSRDPLIQWFQSKHGKKTMQQFFWTFVGIAMIAGVIWAASQRDEQDAQKSGQWFQNQIYKFAPHKFDK